MGRLRLGRIGEISTPVKVVMWIVGGLVAVFLLLIVQKDLLQNIKDPITRIIATALGGL